MDIVLPTPGKYVVAVSGGVDSVVLLDLLNRQPGLDLVVAHYDHGIRQDSAADRQFVAKLAARHELPFSYVEGHLGADASEATARQARYEFLRSLKAERGAAAIITAHHQDDLLETAILNMLRGTNRKGLTSLRNREDVVRPFLGTTKQEIKNYALLHDLKWREDSTNNDQNFLRNYVRQNVVKRINNRDKTRLLNMLSNLQETNQELDSIMDSVLAGQKEGLDRRWFNSLPHDVAKETMASWLRQNELRDFDRHGLERLVVAAKTARPGRRHNVFKGVDLVINGEYLALQASER